MKKIAIAGNIILDIIKIIDSWPKKGMLSNIIEQECAVGGCVSNTAIDLKVLDPDIQVKCYGVIGNDDYGAYVKKVLESYNLDIEQIVITNNSTSYTDVMTVSSGERTFFHNKGCYKDFTIDDINLDSLDCELFHLGYLLLLDRFDEYDCDYGTKASRLLHDVQCKGIKTSIDLVSDSTGKFKEVVLPALKYCNYIVINEIEGGMISDISPRNAEGKLLIDNIKEICLKIKSFGVKNKVVIHAPEGSGIVDENNVFLFVPSLMLPSNYIVGSVGAGDAFCAAMLYSFLNDFESEYSLRLASCVAACNLSVKDSISGARSLEESLELENKFERRYNYDK